MNQHEIESELVVGLVGAVGTEIKLAIEFLTERLELAGYDVGVLKISDQIIQLMGPVNFDPTKQFGRISKMMDAGNEARKKAGDDGVLANGVAALIYDQRPKGDNGRSTPNVRKAYIVDSLKRPEEVSRLRGIYPGGFVLVGVHAEESRRLANMIENRGISDNDARSLIERDSEEKRVPNGQRLNRTFHLADFFVRITDNREMLRGDIKRMVEIWFGHPYTTPTFDEYAMFMAFSAAVRSADLSRQVGAVVVRDDVILSTGANDCPSYPGGLYWPKRGSDGRISDMKGGRDYTLENDPNRREQLRIIGEIVVKCDAAGVDPGKLREILDSSRIADLTEFGRVVHAEMEALLACARIGVSTSGATLYSTTFPCHNCAKHIVAAGIDRVVYVEPYPKSKAIEFHRDSIATSPVAQSTKVQFEPFVGIGPRRYYDLFSMSGGNSYPLKRQDKKTGKTVDWAIEKAKLRIKMLPGSYLEFELDATNSFRELIQRTGQ